MTIATDQVRTISQGNGVVTNWPYYFPIRFATSLELVLSQNGVEEIVNPSLYTVAGVGNAQGGSVTYPLSGAPVPEGTTVILQRKPVFLQTLSLSNQQDFYPEAIEQAGFDSVVEQTQDLNDRQLRAISVTLDTPVINGLFAPSIEERAEKFLSFSSDGLRVVAEVPGTQLLPLVQEATEIAVNAAATAVAASDAAAESLTAINAKITVSDQAPSGGSPGDLWFQYET
jgi:hypothetical protein